MPSEQRFCEECGKPLRPGVKFCEECGSPVAIVGAPVQAAPQPLPPPAPAVLEPQPVAAMPETRPVSVIPETRPVSVIPFCYSGKGLFSHPWCTIVVYPSRIIIAHVPESRARDIDKSVAEVQAALKKKRIDGKKLWEYVSGDGHSFAKVAGGVSGPSADDAAKEEQLFREWGIVTRPWEVYRSMPPDAVLAEDSRNTALTRETIGFIRGEGESNQILIGSYAGLISLFFDFGIFSLARRTLLSFLLPQDGTPEVMSGVIPFWSEPGVKGFEYQYTWNLVVTDRRVIFCVIEEEFADAIGSWYELQEKQAKRAGQKWREGEGAGRPDAPWQRLLEKTVPELLGNELNYFIPLSSIRQVKIVPGKPGKADTLCLSLPGETLSLVFSEGTAPHARGVLERVLPGMVSWSEQDKGC